MPRGGRRNGSGRRRKPVAEHVRLGSYRKDRHGPLPADLQRGATVLPLPMPAAATWEPDADALASLGTAGRAYVERLVAAFRKLPSTPVYSPIATRLEPALRAEPLDGLALIEATSLYLGRRSPQRLQLLAYARTRAAGGAIAHLCLEHGWSRATLYRQIRAAAEVVAAGLNRDRRSIS